MTKKNIALITGGNSSEVVISLKSAAQIKEHLNAARYTSYIIVISGKEWYYENKNGKKISVDRNDFSLLVDGQKIHFDFALIMLHGTPGEDGKLQGYLDLMEIPHSTCGVLSSAITFNKYFCKAFLSPFGIATPASVLVKKKQDLPMDDIEDHIGFPCFVKPNNGGSSFGASRVEHPDELPAAVDNAFEQDTEVLIEELIEGTEITCGLFKKNGKEWIFPVTEIVSKKDFFDYEAKYTPGMAEEITPARISEENAQWCQEVSSRIYDILQCKGIVRMDFIMKDDQFWFLEVNTVPGMSENSIVPKQIKAFGKTVSEVLDILLNDED